MTISLGCFCDAGSKLTVVISLDHSSASSRVSDPTVAVSRCTLFNLFLRHIVLCPCWCHGNHHRQLWTVHGPPRKVHGVFVDCPWIHHGLSMNEPWTVHGPAMDPPWTTMDSPWTTTDCSWHHHGLSMDRHGPPPSTTTDCSWTTMDRHGLLMDNHGARWTPPRTFMDYHGLFMGNHGRP